MRMITIALLLLSGPPLLALDADAIDRYVEQRLREQLTRGGAMVLIQNGRVVESRSFGEAQRGVPMTVDTPMIIGSLSKSFTATAVLQLVDRGLIHLDDPVRTYLPGFRLADEKASTAITIRQLLNQTSGIPTDAPRAKTKNPSLMDHVHALASTALSAPPGDRHIYSSPNYQILGAVVEQVSGMSYGDYLKQNIFEPLGMKHSFVDIASARAAGLAPGHNIWFGLSLPSPYTHEPDRLPTASVITTASDLARFVRAHLAAQPALLTPESLRIAHAGVAQAGDFRYAMGWREGPTAGVRSLWHGGALPSYRGAVVILPQSASAVILLTNTSSLFADHTREIASGVVAMMHERQPAPPARSLRATYGWITAIALVIIVLHIRSVIRSLRVRAPRSSLVKVALLDLALPIVVLLALPRMTHLPWRAMFEGAPDVVTFLVILLATGVVSGIIKIIRSNKVTARGNGASPVQP